METHLIVRHAEDSKFASYTDLNDHLGARDRARHVEARAKDSKRIRKERKTTGYILRIRTRDEGKIPSVRRKDDLGFIKRKVC